MAKEFTKTTEKVKQEIMESSDSAITLFTKEERTKYTKLKKNIDMELGKCEKAYLTIALKVHAIYKDRLFEIDGYKNIYEMAMDKFNLSRGTCNNYVNIVDLFGEYDKEKNEYIGLQEKYKEFKSSQLILMLSMTDEQRAWVEPSMTIKKIKEMKSEFAILNGYADESEEVVESPSNEHADDNPLENGADINLPEDDDINTIIKENNHMMVFECSNMNDFKKKLEQNITVLNDTYIDFKNTNKDIRPKITVSLEW